MGIESKMPMPGHNDWSHVVARTDGPNSFNGRVGSIEEL